MKIEKEYDTVIVSEEHLNSCIKSTRKISYREKFENIIWKCKCSMHLPVVIIFLLYLFIFIVPFWFSYTKITVIIMTFACIFLVFLLLDCSTNGYKKKYVRWKKEKGFE